MSNSLDETVLKEKYSAMSDSELKAEFERIASIPNARTNIEALQQVSAMLPIMEARGIAPRSSQAAAEVDSGPNWGSIGLGILLIVGGLLLSMNTGSVYYGAVLVGIFMLIKGFM